MSAQENSQKRKYNINRAVCSDNRTIIWNTNNAKSKQKLNRIAKSYVFSIHRDSKPPSWRPVQVLELTLDGQLDRGREGLGADGRECITSVDRVVVGRIHDELVLVDRFPRAESVERKVHLFAVSVPHELGQRVAALGLAGQGESVPGSGNVTGVVAGHLWRCGGV